MTMLVTGATGFIGSRLAATLAREGVAVCGLVRPEKVGLFSGLFPALAVRPVAGDLLVPASLRDSCRQIACVFHLAGFAHGDDDALHYRVTVEGTRALLDEAVRQGVGRFVFASSVKAMGEGAQDCLDESSPCRPETAYGRAKLEAERLVLEAGRRHGMHVAVLRLPLVYGPGAKGNLARMIEAVARGRFPPLPETGNRRSLVHVDDVVQALRLAAERAEANGRVYIVTDGQTYSTRQLYVLICQALGRPVPRWSVPAGVLRFAARMGDGLERILRRRLPLSSATLDKLLGSAWYRGERIQRELGYRPTRTFPEALPEMVEEYKRRAGGGPRRASGAVQKGPG